MALVVNSSAKFLGSLVALTLLASGLQGCRRKNAAPPAQAPAAAPVAAPAPVAAQKQEVTPALPAPVVVKDVGLETPEAVLYDEATDLYLVSNISGSPSDKDDNGFISRLNPDGTVNALRWIDGKKADVSLNAPKGMAIANGKLYVADIDFVRVFDAKTGKSIGKAATPGATFLNGVSAGPDGTIYVTDSGVKAGPNGFEPTGTDAVYAIGKSGQAKVLIKDAALHGPNGVFADASGVWVNTFNGKELYNVASGKQEGTVSLPTGGLDGLVRLANGTVLVSSWEGSAVYEGKDGKFTALISNQKSPAAIGFDSKRGALLIPVFLDNQVRIQGLPSSLTAAPAPAAPPPAAAPATPAAKSAAPAATPASAKPTAAAPAVAPAPAKPATPAAPAAAAAPATPAKPATPAAPAPAPAPSAKPTNPAPAPAASAKPATPAAAAPATPAKAATPAAPAAPVAPKK